MKSDFYQIVDFSAHDSDSGSLVMFQGSGVSAKEKLPFEIKRVLVMKGMRPTDVRGGHTHYKNRQVLLAISGGCVVDLDDGKQKITIKLDKFNHGLLLEPYVWHVMKNFEAGTILMVLADTEYDEKDYIRNYDDFLKLIK